MNCASSCCRLIGVDFLWCDLAVLLILCSCLANIPELNIKISLALDNLLEVLLVVPHLFDLLF